MEETLSLPIHIETREVVYHDRNQTIRRVIAHFDGFDKEYFVSDHGQRAALVAVQADRVLLVKQYRLIPNGISLEIPGGRVNENEDPEDAAIRECFEETGVRCRGLRKILSFHSSLDIWLNYTHVFVSEDCEPSIAEANRRMAWIPIEQCVQMVFSATINDALSIASILALRTQRSGFHVH